MRVTLAENKRFLQWFLRIAIPVVILGIHWVLGISLGRSVVLLFMYALAAGFLLAVPIVNLLVYYVFGPVYELYGLRESLPDGSQVRPSIKWLLRLLLYSVILGNVTAGICLDLGLMERLGALACALLFTCYLILWELMGEKPSVSAEELMSDKQEVDLSQLLGRKGKSVTTMRPAGRVRLDGVLYDAVTEGEYVDEEMSVRVVGVRGSELKVRCI